MRYVDAPLSGRAAGEQVDVEPALREFRLNGALGLVESDRDEVPLSAASAGA
jgi:hypothetical protein